MMVDKLAEEAVPVVARALARSHGLGDHMGDEHLKPWLRDARTAAEAALAIAQKRVNELEAALWEATDQLWHLAEDGDDNYLVKKCRAALRQAQSTDVGGEG